MIVRAIVTVSTKRKESSVIPSFHQNPSARLEATVRGRHLGRRSIDPPQEFSLAIRQVVHRVKIDVEARGGVVDGQDVDRGALILKFPTRPTVRATPASDGLRAADVWEVGEGAEGGVLAHQALRAVGAGDVVERRGCGVVGGIVRDGHGRTGGENRGGAEDESRESGKGDHGAM